MNSVETFSISDTFSWGWKQFKTRPWFYVGAILLVFVIGVVLGFLTETEMDDFEPVTILGSLISTVVQWWIYIGLIGILLASYDGKAVSVSQLFEQNGKTLWNYALGSMLYGLIVACGVILLVFPAFIWGIKYQYYSYYIVDKGMGPVEALKQSGVITKGYKWTLLGFILLFTALNFAGVLVFGVGLFVTIPVSLLALTYTYRWLDNKAGLEPKPEVPEEKEEN